VLRASPRGIQVRVTVTNNMTWSSLAHIVTGYNTAPERFIQRWLDNDGIIALHHAGTSHYMTVVYREVIPLRITAP
jgi:hypothetical protein